MQTEYVYVIVDDNGERPPTYGNQTRVYLREAAAKARCRKGYRVIRLNVEDGEVIHEG